jgi:hypothetical protein
MRHIAPRGQLYKDRFKVFGQSASLVHVPMLSAVHYTAEPLGDIGEFQ